jgi:PleD family two-component response regulator
MRREENETLPMNRRIIAAVDDMIFAAKIKGTAQAVDATVEFVRSAAAAVAAIEQAPTALVIVDLHSEKCDPFELAARVKADRKLSGVTLLGFFSHVNIALRQRALAVGFDHVLPRSAFVKRLGDLLSGNP